MIAWFIILITKDAFNHILLRAGSCLWEEVKMRYLLLLLALLVGCVGKDVKVAKQDTFHQHLGDVTVALVFMADDGLFRPFCTGVWITEMDILTAAHCVAEDPETMMFEDAVGVPVYYVMNGEDRGVGEIPGAVHHGNVKAFDPGHDLAIVRVSVQGMEDHDVAELANELPAVGSKTYMVGHPKGLYWTFMEGLVSGYRDTALGHNIQVNGSVWFGNSGGGLFNEEGELIGIASRLVGMPSMCYYGSLIEIKKFVDFELAADGIVFKKK